MCSYCSANLKMVVYNADAKRKRFFVVDDEEDCAPIESSFMVM